MNGAIIYRRGPSVRGREHESLQVLGEMIVEDFTTGMCWGGSSDDLAMPVKMFQEVSSQFT